MKVKKQLRADITFLDKTIAFLKALVEKRDTFTLIEDSRGFYFIPTTDISGINVSPSCTKDDPDSVEIDAIDTDYQIRGM